MSFRRRLARGDTAATLASSSLAAARLRPNSALSLRPTPFDGVVTLRVPAQSMTIAGLSSRLRLGKLWIIAARIVRLSSCAAAGNPRAART